MKTGDFEAPVAVREKEGERLIEGAHGKDTDRGGGVGRHTSRRRESDQPEGGSAFERGGSEPEGGWLYVGL